MPTLHCSTCNKPIHRCQSKADKYEKSYCNVICQAGNVTSWIGYLIANCPTMSRREIAAHIGIPLVTLRCWIFRINKMGVKIPYEKKGPPPKKVKVKKVKVKKPQPVKKSKPIKKVKEVKYTQSMRREPKPAKKVVVKQVDMTAVKSVRIDRKTVILAPKHIPDQTVIDNWYKKRSA